MAAVTSKFVSYASAYQKACIKATLASMRKASQLVAKRGRQLAPRARVHRVSRMYPGGRKYDDAKRISQSITSRAKVGKGGIQVYGWAKVKVGYSVFVEYGTKFMRPVSFMRRALAQTKDGVFKILQGEWPK